jgi:hypothetical protein
VAPGKVTGGGAHPSGMPTVRERSSGRWLRTSMPNVEVVAGGDPDEVQRLGGGYAVVRVEPIRKRKHGCGAHRGGKQRRFRSMHGLCRERRKRCRRASVPNTAAKRKGEMEGVDGF